MRYPSLVLLAALFAHSSFADPQCAMTVKKSGQSSVYRISIRPNSRTVVDANGTYQSVPKDRYEMGAYRMIVSYSSSKPWNKGTDILVTAAENETAMLIKLATSAFIPSESGQTMGEFDFTVHGFYDDQVQIRCTNY